VNQKTNTSSLMAKPYVERRLLVVSNEAVLKAVEEEQKKQSVAKKADGFDWAGMATAAGSLAVRAVSWEYSVGKILVGIGIEAYRALSKAREGGAPIRAISFEEAAQLTFPPGHPREGVVYVGHPVVPDTYYTMADFHRVVFEHKFAEAMLLLMSLGAKTMRVEHITGWSSEFAGNLDVAVPAQPMTVGLNVGGNLNKDKSLLFAASLDGTHAPKLPTNMAWFPHEPMWSGIAKGRIEFGLSRFTLAVRYRDDYGIDSKLSALVEGAGLKIGGKFEAHRATVWQIEGSFTDSEELATREVIIDQPEQLDRI